MWLQCGLRLGRPFFNDCDIPACKLGYQIFRVHIVCDLLERCRVAVIAVKEFLEIPAIPFLVSSYPAVI